MSIVFSNPVPSAFVSAGVTLTQAYTVPAAAKELWLFGYADNANTSVPLPNIMAYGGLNATFVDAVPADAGGTGQLHFFYRILNPVAGTANITARHPTLPFAIEAVCLLVDQNYIMTHSAFSYANTATPSVGIASATGDKTLFSLTVNNVDTTAVSETGGQTVLSEGGSSVQAMHQLSQKTSAGPTNTATWSVSGGSQRTSGFAINVKEIAQSLTIDTPLVPGAARTDACTGFPDGDAVISFAGVTIDVTIESDLIEYTVPMLADGVQWPRLPATAQTITLTQDELLATDSADISLPAGFDTVRDGAGDPADFAALVTDDGTYLQPAFIAAGNPLTTDDTAVHVTSGAYLVRQNGAVGALTSTLPRTDPLWVYRGGDGAYYLHMVTLVSAGAPPIVTPSLAPRSRSLLRISGSTLTIDGVAHTNGQPISLSPYGGIQSGINGQWLAQSVSASAGNLVVDGATIVPPKALYLSPAGKLTATPNGQAVATVRP